MAKYGSEFYGDDLHSVHAAMLAKMKNNTSKKEAAELQTILQEIKWVAHHLEDEIMPNNTIGEELIAQYKELIDNAFNIQKQFHNTSFQKTSLFRREHDRNAHLKSGADDIFEEELASILAALGAQSNASSDLGTREYYLVGGKTAQSIALNKMTEEITDKAIKTINRLAEAVGKKETEQVKEIKATVHKTDVIGYPAEVVFNLDVHPKINRLVELMKDAAFSAKNYKSYAYDEMKKKDFEELYIHLGDSNLYKAVLGALSEIKMSYEAKEKFFFRGANIYLSNKYGLAEEVEKHFSDLRFVYELRGSGLLSDNGVILPVKYLIYNDPNSDAIFVKDTASIVLDGFEKSRSLFGSINISASRIKS